MTQSAISSCSNNTTFFPKLRNFRAAIQAGDFLITAEVSPPKGGDATEMLNMAKLLKDRVHAVNITDGSRAVMRMCPLAATIMLLQQGIEPICQVACRDRNRIGLQADLLGANALGIHNILALTGDPVKAGDHTDAKSVFDMESVRLLQMIKKLNLGVDWNGRKLTDGATDLFPGAAVDPQSHSWSGLQRRFERKIQAGAEFFQSQLICDFDKLDKFMHQIAASSGKPILAGIFLIKSAKNARFLNKNVPGIEISQEIINRLDRATDPLQEGITIAAEQINMAQKICHGVHIMAIKREDLIPQILDRAGITKLK